MQTEGAGLAMISPRSGATGRCRSVRLPLRSPLLDADVDSVDGTRPAVTGSGA